MNEEKIIGAYANSDTIPPSRAIGDRIAMQMAAITYCSINGGNIKKTVTKYLPKWELVWEPVQAIGGNYAFIAFNGIQYVIAIRGSILNFSIGTFDDWIKEDFTILEQVPWTYPSSKTKPMISKGSADGLANIIDLKDSKGDTILEFLLQNAIPSGKFLCVTGHSLGGNLATVFAPWLLYQIQQDFQTVPAVFSVLTFAAPTSWNEAFSDMFNASFTNSWRYFNSIDIVPFSGCNIEGLGLLYSNNEANTIYHDYLGEKISLADFFDTLAALVLASEIKNSSFYFPVNQYRGTIQINIKKELFKVKATTPVEKWFEQAAAQHNHNHYLKFLGTNTIHCCD
jgi:triacylglycerol lipase